MKKGITLAVLSVVILVMVVLITAVTTTGSMALNNSKKIKFASEIALVQELVDEYANSKGEYPTSTSLDVDLSNVTTNSLTQFDEEVKNGNLITLYEIDFSLLGKTDLIYGTKEDSDATDIYAISETTGKVYYIKGVKVSKITYYTLTDDLKEAIGYTSNTGAVTKDGIIFTASKTTWTNQSIDSTLKIPNSSEYSGIVVYLLEDNDYPRNLEVSETTSDYNIYNIGGVVGNYAVEVEYTKNSNPSSQSFSVTNFDNIKPTITVKTIKDLINQEDDINQAYINLDISDNMSGIKSAKYETESILEANAKQYFSNNGLNISNNTIVVNSDIKYVTVYIEDKAGNYITKLIRTDISTNDYANDGLVLHYDGINNTGDGHDDTARVWKDLSGNGNDVALKSDNSFDNNSCTFVKTANSGFSPNNPLKQGVNGGFTIECIAKSNTTETSETTNFNLYNWFWNIRDNSGKTYMQFIRDYTGVYRMSVLCNNPIVKDEVPGNSITSSQLVVTNSKIKHYYDGVLTFEEDFSDEIFNAMLAINNLDLGYAKWNSWVSLDGNIYSFRIYNRPLSEEEIIQNYEIDSIRFEL